MDQRNILIGLGLVGLAGAAWWWWSNREEDEEIEVDLLTGEATTRRQRRRDRRAQDAFRPVPIPTRPTTTAPPLTTGPVQAPFTATPMAPGSPMRTTQVLTKPAAQPPPTYTKPLYEQPAETVAPMAPSGAVGSDPAYLLSPEMQPAGDYEPKVVRLNGF